MEKSIEDSFLLKTSQFTDRRYSIGLFNKEELFVQEEWIRSTIQSGHSIRDIEFNIKTKEVKVIVDEGRSVISNENENEFNSMVDLNEDGIRWEGLVVNGNPFGYGRVYNSSNELIYRGIMIGDKKECFGTEFYSDLGQIEYIGCYWNNERHGFGMLYDRKGQLLYEGDWLFGSSEYEMNVVLKSIDNERMVHNLIHELVIDERVGNEMNNDLILCGFEKLESIVVKKGSLKNLKSLKISDNLVLKSIEIENGELVFDYPAGAFCNVKTVTITSHLIYD